jgi:hypothetical protein
MAKQPKQQGGDDSGATFQVRIGGGGQTLKVGKDELWRFTSHGDWSDGRQACGPQGYREFIPYILDIRPEVEDAPYGCVIGKFKGRSGSAFRIGLGTVRRFDEDGEIEFSGNLLKAYAGKASGEVSITAERLDEEVAWPKGLAAFWSLVRTTMDKTAGVGFITVLVLLLGWALIFLPQGQDLVRGVSEDEASARNLMPGWRQLWFGVALFFLSMQAWFWPRVIINFNYGSDRSTWRPHGFLEWTPRVLGVLPGLLAFVAVIRSPAANTTFAAIIAVGALAFFIWILRRNDLWSRITRRRRENPDTTPPRVGRFWVLTGLGLGLVSMILFSLDPVGVPRHMGPPAVVFLGVALIITPIVIAIQVGAPTRFPVLGALLLVAVLIGLYLDNHRVGRRAWVAELEPAQVHQVNLADAYAAWRKTVQPVDGQLPVILVASEGGASRAGYWTGEVLMALHEATGGRFSDHTFAISSVSGGSVGAVGYAAALQEGRRDRAAFETQVRAIAGDDALSPAIAGMLFPDLLQRFVPFPVLPDRAEALERSWEAAWKSACNGRATCDEKRISGSFLDIWKALDQPQATPAPWTPFVIVNGASEETGRRLLTSKLRLTTGQIDANDFFVTTGVNIPASSAIHNGARFPYVSPAGTVVDKDRDAHGHVIDGGYFDPAGTEVIRELAAAIRAAAPAADKPQLRFIFVFIGYRSSPDYVADDKVDTATGAGIAGSKTNRLANELRAPGIGMVSSRDAHARHMARNLRAEVLNGAFGPGATYVPMLLCDNPNDPDGKSKFVMPMDWVLSEHAKGLMQAGVTGCKGNAGGIATIKALWEPKPKPPAAAGAAAPAAPVPSRSGT